MDLQQDFASRADVFRWMDGFINMERGQSSKSFRLDRMELLVTLAGRPDRFCPTVHVAGSKGKGSTTTMIASILDAAGLKTGLYVSPHVVDYSERVGLARGPFPEEVYVDAGREAREVLDRALSSGPGGRGPYLPGGEEPTFFELTTLLFFLCCRRSSCAAAAVETGMGGRLDATNVVDPEAAVITPIELEHTEFLGTTIPAIAAEKAGIIKAGRPVIVARQDPAALEVFRRVAAERDSPLRYAPEEARVADLRVSREGTRARIDFADPSLFPSPLDVELALVGEVQAENAALAALAVRTAFPRVDDGAILRGLSAATLPARFERVSDDPPVVVDGAHTARSVRIAADAFAPLYGDGGVLLFACALGKDVRAMSEVLALRFSRIFVTTPGDFKKSDPEEAYRAFAALNPRTELVADPEEATRRAVEAARAAALPVLATGSFYLAAIARKCAKP